MKAKTEMAMAVAISGRQISAKENINILQ